MDRRFGDETDFFDCVLFGGGATVIDKWFHKGSEIVVSGEGQLRAYEGKDGVKRKAYSIVVNTFDFCGSKNNSSDRKNDTGDSWEQLEEDSPF